MYSHDTDIIRRIDEGS